MPSFTRMPMLVRAAVPPSATAQSWPAKSIRLIIPNPAGGTADILARMIGPKLTAGWGPQIIVDNRFGANDNIATDITARACADSFIMVLTDPGIAAIRPGIYNKLPFAIEYDLPPMAMASYSTHF